MTKTCKQCKNTLDDSAFDTKDICMGCDEFNKVESKEDWIEEFDRLFYDNHGELLTRSINVGKNVNVKDFIRDLLKVARDEGYEAGLNLRKEYNDPDLLEKIRQLPLGVSQWRNMGEKYSYDLFFERRIKENILKWVKENTEVREVWNKEEIDYNNEPLIFAPDLIKFIEKL